MVSIHELHSHVLLHSSLYDPYSFAKHGHGESKNRNYRRPSYLSLLTTRIKFFHEMKGLCAHSPFDIITPLR